MCSCSVLPERCYISRGVIAPASSGATRGASSGGGSPTHGSQYPVSSALAAAAGSSLLQVLHSIWCAVVNASNSCFIEAYLSGCELQRLVVSVGSVLMLNRKSHSGLQNAVTSAERAHVSRKQEQQTTASRGRC